MSTNILITSLYTMILLWFLTMYGIICSEVSDASAHTWTKFKQPENGGKRFIWNVETQPAGCKNPKDTHLATPAMIVSILYNCISAWNK